MGREKSALSKTGWVGGLTVCEGWGTARYRSAGGFKRRRGDTAWWRCLGVVGGLFLGVRGSAAFWAVLVCLPGGGGGSLEPLLHA